MKSKTFLILMMVLVLFQISDSQGIYSTKHNLSTSSSGVIKSNNESEICVFCHTPHNAGARQPLWNRNTSGATYTLYNSSTTQASIGQPSGSSILCLSCHDGTIALGNVLSRSTPISMVGTTAGKIPTTSKSNLSTDLSDDHPISFSYSSGLAIADGELKDPSNLTGQVQLENGLLQCTSCHDAHKNINGKFLVVTNQESILCLSCHNKTNWNLSTHNSSTKIWNGLGTNPWLHTSFLNVKSNACENCHNPHNAEGHKWLENYVTEETNCLVCHNGNVAATNIQTQLTKTYKHNVAGYSQIHTPNENALVTTKHDECVDCHNPHQSNNTTASAPNANGFIKGTKGIDTNGNPVNPINKQYELCYRCHADSPDKPGSPTTRAIAQNNVRLEFDPTNPSYHPIEAVGKNSNVPDLLSPWTTSSIMYCTNCHASDGGTGTPKGPHGSIYPQILRYQYTKADNTPESSSAYALCYSCHNRTQIIASSGNGNFQNNVHNKHIVGVRAPCNACHDPHGISSTQGNATNNLHLINFDLTIVSKLSGTSGPRWEMQGSFRGRCYLVCHGETHNPKSY